MFTLKNLTANGKAVEIQFGRLDVRRDDPHPSTPGLLSWSVHVGGQTIPDFDSGDELEVELLASGNESFKGQALVRELNVDSLGMRIHLQGSGELQGFDQETDF